MAKAGHSPPPTRGSRSLSINTSVSRTPMPSTEIRPASDQRSIIRQEDDAAAMDDASPSRRRQPKRAVKGQQHYESDPSMSHDFAESSSSSRHVRSHSVSSMGSDEVRYTKTGRVSKALKGKRVHQCEICGKSYTRAEHMRRHRLNHEGQMLQCNVAGCTRQFVRSDLLLRHREEHKTAREQGRDGASSTDGGIPSYSAPHTEPYPGVNAGLAGGVSTSRGESPYPSFGDSAMPVKEPYFDTTVPYQGYTIACDGPYGTSIGVSCNDWGTMSYKSSPSLFGTPAPDKFGEGPQDAFFGQTVLPAHLTNAFSLEEFGGLRFDFGGSETPASVSSSQMPVWGQLEENLRFRGMASTPNSTASFPPTQGTSLYEGVGLFGAPTASSTAASVAMNGPFVDPYFSFHELDQCEAVRIASKLSGLPGVTLDSEGGAADLGLLHDAYLPLYWERFHPLFPAVHRPSFSAHPAPPLLKSLMAAIGASYSDKLESKLLARSMREACFGLLEKRPTIPYSQCRIWDLLTIFLAEVFQLYRARRPVLRLSSRFENMLSSLQNDPHVLARQALDEAVNVPFDAQPELLEQLHIDWINEETKRRLYLASSLIELQHKSFFQPHLQIPDRDLPPPCTPSLYQATTVQEWHRLAKAEPPRDTRLYDAITGYTVPDALAFDPFESAVIVANATRQQDILPYPMDAGYLDILDKHPRTLLQHHSLLLAKTTPIWDLLAVSGESFVLGNKLATRAQYVQAKTDLATWKRSDSARSAVRHALEVIRIVRTAGKCDLLHAEWVLYIAVLVCWTVSVWATPTTPDGKAATTTTSTLATSSNHLQPPVNGVVNSDQLSVPQSTRTVRFHANTQPHQIEEQMELLVRDSSANTNSIVLDPISVVAALIWSKKHISGQLGGLVEDAVVVLSKLAEGSRLS